MCIRRPLNQGSLQRHWWELIDAADDGDHRSDHVFLVLRPRRRRRPKSHGIGQELAARRYRVPSGAVGQVTPVCMVDDGRSRSRYPRAWFEPVR